MALIGYARVSTPHQSLDNQIFVLEKYGCEKIFSEVISGSKDKRTQFDTCLDYIRPGDTLVVIKLDRLSRTVKQLLELIKFFDDENINFISINDAIDTTTPMGKFAFHICASFIELERDIIRERVLSGLAAGRARGRRGGRPKKFDDLTRLRIHDLYQNKKMFAREIASIYNCKTPIIYKIVRDINAEKKSLDIANKKNQTKSIEDE